MSEQDITELEKVKGDLIDVIWNIFCGDRQFSASVLYQSNHTCEKCYNKWRIYTIEIDE